MHGGACIKYVRPNDRWVGKGKALLMFTGLVGPPPACNIYLWQGRQGLEMGKVKSVLALTE